MWPMRIYEFVWWNYCRGLKDLTSFQDGICMGIFDVIRFLYFLDEMVFYFLLFVIVEGELNYLKIFSFYPRFNFFNSVR